MVYLGVQVYFLSDVFSLVSTSFNFLTLKGRTFLYAEVPQDYDKTEKFLSSSDNGSQPIHVRLQHNAMFVGTVPLGL
jgi:hypothetical protein